jgi:hypothetical protein
MWGVFSRAPEFAALDWAIQQSTLQASMKNVIGRERIGLRQRSRVINNP